MSKKNKDFDVRNLLGWLFGLFADLIAGGERSFLDLISAGVPYAVPVIPAFLTYTHVQDELGFNKTIALTAAFVVETLGMASMNTAIRFWYHNQRYKKDTNKAPFWLAVGVYSFYLVIVILVNVILEMVSGERSGLLIITIALFTMLSVPSGVLIAIRAQYTDVLDRIDSTYKKGSSGGAQTAASGTKKGKPASHYRDRILDMLDAEYSKSGQVLSPKSITSRLRIPHANNKGYVSTLTSQWKQDKGIN